MMNDREKQTVQSWNGRTTLVLGGGLSASVVAEGKRDAQRPFVDEKLDAHWTAITRYLDGLFFPKEG